MRLGKPLRACCFAGLLLTLWFRATAATFTVTTAADSSNDPTKGYSLRDAINAANANPGLDRIEFAIPAGGGVAQIVLNTELPTIRDPVQIDAYTQPGARTNSLAVGNNAQLKVGIDASNTQANYSRAFLVEADGCLIRGFIINNCLDAGVVISYANNNVIAGNWIGLQADGTTPSAGRKNQDGLWILHGAANTVGGLSPGDRNLISGNLGTGIAIGYDESTANAILNNYIGTDWSGMVQVPNQIGVFLGGPGNLLGDGSVAGRNIISGNTFGVQVSPWGGSRPQANSLAGNYIGLAADGDTLLPNAGSGVVLVDAVQTAIGSILPGQGNVISGNGNAGVYLVTHYGASSDPSIVTANNVIWGNLIGTDKTGTKARGNGSGGIMFEGDPFGSLTNNSIGGVVNGARVANIISGNQGNGIQITGANATNNVIQANFIGVDKTGAKALPNAWAGILIGPDQQNPANGSPTANQIGGTGALSGNVISGNLFDGVALDFAATASQPIGGGHLIQGNFIGTDVKGQSRIPNQQSGISLHGACSQVQIGGEEPGAGNVISGNAGAGIVAEGAHNAFCRIQGNVIGMDLTGMLTVPNGTNGIQLGTVASPLNGACTNLIGGTQLSQRNIITGNQGEGILICNGSGNQILGNYIGVGASGQFPIGNSTYGVAILADSPTYFASFNHIGSVDPGGGNLIGGNQSCGIIIRGTNAIGNTVQGNFIGTDSTGAINLGNLNSGILIDNASNTVIGAGFADTPTTHSANRIAYNQGYGVQVTGNSAIGTCIRGNNIGLNSDVAIVLGQIPEPPLGDPLDLDAGPNQMMDYPMLVSTNSDALGANWTLSGWVDSRDPVHAKVDLYIINADSSVRYLATEQPDTTGWFCDHRSMVLAPGEGIVATTTSPQGSTSCLSPLPSMRLRALEVNQSVQDWSNSVPLIEGKKTYVRVFLETLDGAPHAVSLNELSPQLHGARNGLELPNSPRKPILFGDLNLTGDAAANRAVLVGSVNFRVPVDWCTGQLTLWFSGIGVTCGEPVPGNPGDLSCPCRECGATVQFQPSPRLKIKLVDVSYSVSNPTTRMTGYANSQDELDLTLALIKAMYPVANVDVSSGKLALGILTNVPAPVEVNKRLDTVFGTITGFFSNRKILGIIAGVPNGVPGTSTVVGQTVGNNTIASSYYTLPYGDCRVAPAHELGHEMGLHHSITRLVQFANTDHLLYWEGQCHEDSPEPGEPDARLSGFPYSFNGKPSLGPFDQGTDAIVFGLDTSNDATPVVMNPTAVFDLMSYCDNPTWGDWLSQTNYVQLLTNANALFGAQPAVAKDATDLLLVRGSANLWAGTVEFTPFSRWPGPGGSANIAPGDYELELLGADGGVLFATLFQPTRYDSSDSTVARSGGFILPVPMNPAYHAARILRKGVVLATRTASSHVPVLTNLTPNGGEVINGSSLTIGWSAQDADGDPLTYDVQFSPDGGTTWSGLQADWTDTQLVVDRAVLPGTSNAIVRVIASDGFNTAVRTSAGVFTLPDLPPRLRITAPTSGQNFRRQQEIVFAAFAQDPEDGALDGTNVVWRSDRSGVLGQGATLLYDAAALATGQHQITASAFDHLGQLASASVSIMVSSNAPASYADLSVQTAVWPTTPSPGANFTVTLAVNNGGRDPATSVRLTNSVPSGLSLLSVSTSQGTWANQNGVMVASLGNIGPQTNATVTLVFTAAAVGLYTNTAMVGGTEADPVPANNTASQQIRVTESPPVLPDLVVAISESPTNTPVGGTGDYLVTMLNSGQAPATQVSLTNWLPAGVTLQSAAVSSGGQWSAQGGQVIAQFASMPAGSQAWLQLTVSVNSADPLFDRAVAFGAEGDSQPLDNEATSIITAVATSVSVFRDASGIRIGWPQGSSFVVEQTDQLGPNAQWTAVQGTPILDQGRWYLVVQPSGNHMFYRLRAL